MPRRKQDQRKGKSREKWNSNVNWGERTPNFRLGWANVNYVHGGKWQRQRRSHFGRAGGNFCRRQVDTLERRKNLFQEAWHHGPAPSFIDCLIQTKSGCVVRHIAFISLWNVNMQICNWEFNTEVFFFGRCKGPGKYPGSSQSLNSLLTPAFCSLHSSPLVRSTDIRSFHM